jgi:bacterioferritin-associated ferredoxin
VADKIMVCRCEDVTLSEVREAVHKGHDDLESLKRYTGFGTGWCQGKQCVALATRILVELGGQAPKIPITPRPPFHPIPFCHLAKLVDDEDAK